MSMWIRFILRADTHSYEPTQRDMINIAKVICLYIQVTT